MLIFFFKRRRGYRKPFIANQSGNDKDRGEFLNNGGVTRNTGTVRTYLLSETVEKDVCKGYKRWHWEVDWRGTVDFPYVCNTKILCDPINRLFSLASVHPPT